MVVMSLYIPTARSLRMCSRAKTPRSSGWCCTSSRTSPSLRGSSSENITSKPPYITLSPLFYHTSPSSYGPVIAPLSNCYSMPPPRSLASFSLPLHFLLTPHPLLPPLSHCHFRKLTSPPQDMDVWYFNAWTGVYQLAFGVATVLTVFLPLPPPAKSVAFSEFPGYLAESFTCFAGTLHTSRQRPMSLTACSFQQCAVLAP